MENIVWSHSKLNTLLNNPAEYYLYYVQGIQPKIEKTALSIGSAIHWGLENQTSDLQPYYNEKGSFAQWNNYTDEQCLAECIVEAFLKRQKEVIDDILKDDETLEILDVMSIERELRLTGHLDSKLYPDGHDFLGIIDLLILTNKGFILIDYKTSSRDVEWKSYKSQLFKYDFLLQYNFPEIPLYKVGIINLKKTGIKRKKGESDIAFRQRIREQYIVDDTLINWHCYSKAEFSVEELNHFKEDLSGMLDVGRGIVENQLFYTNLSNIQGMYGESQYADIFYHRDDAWYSYIIKDTIYDLDEQAMLSKRNCEDIDMLVLTNKNVLNKYNLFKSAADKIFSINKSTTKQQLFDELKENYICSDKLLEQYFITMEHEN
ncbi:MAG: PD-(D/E)XK nuclease family protein [Erysipelotrichaceae bacterium]|nr:PD-(D/E)XK nuclease family protein [Erysipelotrichaceae bacterium]